MKKITNRTRPAITPFAPRITLLITLLITGGCSSISSVNTSKTIKPAQIENAEISAADNTIRQHKVSSRQYVPQSGNPAEKLITEISRTDNRLKSVDGVDENSALTLNETQGFSNNGQRSQPPVDLWVHMRNSFDLEYSKPDDPTIAHFEKWYSNHPKYFERIADRAYWYMPYILEQVEARGMPAEVAILPAIESAYRAEAVSKSNAVGMWQFMAPTGTRFGLRRDWWMEGRRDLVHSTRAALDYLDFLSREFNGDWELAFAAYNAGEGTIRREVKRNAAAGKPTNYPNLKLRKETREYVPKLFAVRNIIANPEKYGINLKSIPNEPTLAVLNLRAQTDLVVAASLIPIDESELLHLNQGYKRGVTPPNGPHQIVVPYIYGKQLASELDKLSHHQRLRWARHEVRKGEYLGRIARQHGVTVDSIMRTNQMASNLITPGQELKIPLSSGRYEYADFADSGIKINQGDRVYTVRKGDSLWRISQTNGIPLASILRWNDISKSSTLRPGQQLIVGKSS
jgi:membrane-bound lytic murein transglycosylase D